ncbi:tyrosine-type recombinase/integrase [Rhizobacter sp. J219]|uniref:tyrosine-type recombinase/integrase n=1 Tax=Rhizobacter sp. J219 TaxID=2898430 RepID=UPI0021510010|nr:site-specific integrase [Rhizobacter sp. J219]MCR5882967.1 tyrosine-type recombinase/integrase [Rhizobacter sp. J219]
MAELKAIPKEWKGDTLSDGDGLSGEVRAAGDGAVSIRFKSAFKWQGKVTWHQCGTWPVVSMVDIRQRRDQARAALKTGLNPNDQKKANRIEQQSRLEATIVEAEKQKAALLTFEEMFEAWLSTGVSRDDGNAELRRTFNKDVLPELGRKPISAITDQDLIAVLRKIGRDRGAGRTAQRMLTELRQLYRWAGKRQPWRGQLTDGNPAELVEPDQVVREDYEDGVRERVLSAEELRELANILVAMRRDHEALPAGSRSDLPRPLKRESELALWIALSTLCRIGEILKARWEHVDVETGEWFLPAQNTKTKVAMMVYLSPFALRQFEQLKLLTGHTDWCFPARPEGRVRDGAACADTHVDLKSVSKQVGDRQIMFMSRTGPLPRRRNDNALVLAKGKNGEWTPHDLRRTGATMMQALGVPLDVIDRCQNHALPGPRIRRHYLHHEYAQEKRDAWRLLGETLSSIVAAQTPTSPPVQANVAEDALI